METGLLGVSLKTEKVITLLSMTIITFLFGMLPLKMFTQMRTTADVTARIRWRTFKSLCQCFSGGVFIAACLLDLLPDVEEKVQQVLDEIKDEYKVEVDYPVAQFIMVCGFFLILVIEQATLEMQERWLARAEERAPLLSSGPGPDYHTGHSHHHHHHHEHQHPSIAGLSGEVHHAGDGHGHHHSHATHSLFQHSALRSLMLLIALSFHSVFEGMAIGLQESSAQLISIFIAVIVHKAVMAFSLGLNTAQSSLSTKSFVLSNVLFSLSSPLGVGLGMAVSDLPVSLPQDICNGVLQGIAGGTFLFITFFEVLPHELNVPGKRLVKVFFVILGFASICGLLFITH